MMGKDKKPYERRGKRSLTQEEQELWKQISQQIKPLKADDRSVDSPSSDAFSKAEMLKPQPDRAERMQKKTAIKRPSNKTVDAPPSAKPPAPKAQISEFDEKLAHKVGKGRIKIDARLDLHGMRQNEAKSELRQFIFSSFSKGHKVVLVITGKGTSVRTDAPWSGEAVTDRGVLKRMVPYWLSERDMAAAVVSYTTARLQHGGEGALYVHIRGRKQRHKNV